MPMSQKFALVQLLYLGQSIPYLFQSLVQHVLAHAHRLARATEQPGNLSLVLHHEIRLRKIKCR
ncbi:hypothetical protein D3C79_720950 [compost metagenome]